MKKFKNVVLSSIMVLTSVLASGCGGDKLNLIEFDKYKYTQATETETNTLIANISNPEFTSNFEKEYRVEYSADFLLQGGYMNGVIDVQQTNETTQKIFSTLNMNHLDKNYSLKSYAIKNTTSMEVAFYFLDNISGIGVSYYHNFNPIPTITQEQAVALMFADAASLGLTDAHQELCYYSIYLPSLDPYQSIYQTFPEILFNGLKYGNTSGENFTVEQNKDLFKLTYTKQTDVLKAPFDDSLQESSEDCKCISYLELSNNKLVSAQSKQIVYDEMFEDTLQASIRLHKTDNEFKMPDTSDYNTSIQKTLEQLSKIYPEMSE